MQKNKDLTENKAQAKSGRSFSGGFHNKKKNRPGARQVENTPLQKSAPGKKTSVGQKQSAAKAPANTKPANTKKNSAKGSAKNSAKKKEASHGRTGGRKSANKSSVKIAFIGGLNEIGKNMTVYECEDEMIIVDCGLAFPDPDMFGVDLVIPDFSYIERNADKIKGIFITHGHEDHIGGLPYLLKTVNVPVYSTKLTIGLISSKLKEEKLLNKAGLNVVSPGDKVKVGGFEVECIHVNHSIPDALAFAIRCKAGTVFQTGDFKIDTTPIDGGMIDLARISQIGSEGVLCMLSDSTNAEKKGFSDSERKVGESLEILFRKAGNRRILVATFASNIHRIQQIINVAHKLKRKVALSGRSLENVVAISAELGYINIPEGILIGIDSIKKYTPDQLVIITTGSQGEPMSALTRMAMSDHRVVAICPNDYVIISATPIPGNEKTVGRVINELLKLGAEVVYEKMYDIHVSGHACQEELKIMMGILKPKYFIPVHGEQKHMRRHAALAESVGISSKNIFVADNGTAIEVSESGIRELSPVPAGRIFVDGYGVGDIGNAVLRDRKHLSQDGLIVVSVSIDTKMGLLVAGPEIVSKGFVYEKDAEDLFAEARERVEDALQKCMRKSRVDIPAIKSRIKDEVSKLMYERTKRSPIVLPIVLEE
ncbi:MAG: RNase J family beta-CASP ribonuclease [Clostridiales bacterium]|nr:RNase J family beta-CASP ribonuclease [Clostridiales bacterium]